MGIRRLVGSSTVAVLLSVASLGAAARSDVADAVMRGDTAALRALLEQHADVNTTQADGATALHWAVYRGDVSGLELLIKAGANVKVANRDGATPLSLACVNGNPALVETLLKAGADANERLPNGETALMMASRSGSLAAMKALLDHGAEVNAKEKLRGTTALMWAAAQGHPDAVQFLVSRGADVSARSNPDISFDRGGGGGVGGKTGDPRPNRKEAALNAARGAGRVRLEATMNLARRGPSSNLDGGALTALSFAARRGDLESTQILLAAGADVNQVTGFEWSPLLVATHNRNYKIAELLFNKGADPNIANKGGWTPLYIAVDNRNIETGDYPVRRADLDHLDLIKKLLAQGANVNARMKSNTERRTVFRGQWVNEDGETAFMRAAESSDLVVMRLLLSYGADPMIATRANVDALQVASGIGWVEGLTYEWSEAANVETVKLLLDLGLDPNAQANSGRGALHGAGHKGRTAIVQLLVDAGADVGLKDYGMEGEEAGGRLTEQRWQAVDYADGLVRIGTQSPIEQPAAGLLLRKLMQEKGLYVPAFNRTIESVCVTAVCE